MACSGHTCNKSAAIAQLLESEVTVDIQSFVEGSYRELFIQGKAMVPYVQLSTNCKIGC